MASTINGTSTGSGGLVSTGDDSGILNIQTNETTAMSIDASQRVAFVAGTDALPAITTTGDTNTGIFFPAADTIAFSTGASERARITSAGDFVIATTSAVGSSRFTILGASNRNGIAVQAGDDANYNYIGFNTVGTRTFNVFGTGNVQNTNNSYGAISDVKLKENIVDATPKLANLMQVKIRNYNLIGETTKQIGVVAQELETVFPTMVDETPDRDAENNDLGTTTKSVKYSVFVPMLIKAIQEQQAIIETLTQRITALEGA
jgi:hypothetical protein